VGKRRDSQVGCKKENADWAWIREGNGGNYREELKKKKGERRKTGSCYSETQKEEEKGPRGGKRGLAKSPQSERTKEKKKTGNSPSLLSLSHQGETREEKRENQLLCSKVRKRREPQGGWKKGGEIKDGSEGERKACLYFVRGRRGGTLMEGFGGGKKRKRRRGTAG